MTEAMTIRDATAADRDAVVALWRACGLVASYNDPARDFDFAVEGACSTILVTDIEGAVRSSVMVGHDGHRGWLYYVATDPACRKRQIGRRTVLAAETWLRDRGVEKVQLLVRETNTGVIGFYEGLGFEVAPRVMMAKWLKDEVPPEPA